MESLEQAVEALEQGRYTEAAAGFDRLLSHSPSGRLHFQRARAAMFLGDVETAARHLDHVLEQSPDHHPAREMRAESWIIQERYRAALEDYRILDEHQMLGAHQLVRVLRCWSLVPLEELTLADAPALERLLGRPDLDLSRLARPASQVLWLRYAAVANAPDLDLEQLAADPFLCGALSHLILCSSPLERFLSRARSQLFRHIIQTGKPHAFALLEALVLQGAHNEYIWAETPIEQQILSQLRTLLPMLLGQNNVEALSTPLVLWSLYRPCRAIPGIDALHALSDHDWPEWVSASIRDQLQQALAPPDSTAGIRRLGRIGDQVSVEVRKQYEVNPYPRWRSYHPPKPSRYGDILSASVTGFTPPAWTHKPLRVLVAGCGTGRQAITVAQSYEQVHVTAIDLSLASLAYGRKMATQLQVHNIEFVHLDILDVHLLQQRFDVIESVGVLHHMGDYEAGWKALCQVLRPDGILFIGLYSSRARRHIKVLRELIHRKQLRPGPPAIRAFRHALSSSRPSEFRDAVLQSADFYNLSTCRDLLFHVHEQPVTPLEIHESCSRLGLQFLGFNQFHRVLEAYSRAHPDDPNRTNLQYWDAFEHKHPDIFAGMLNFWCTPRA